MAQILNNGIQIGQSAPEVNPINEYPIIFTNAVNGELLSANISPRMPTLNPTPVETKIIGVCISRYMLFSFRYIE